MLTNVFAWTLTVILYPFALLYTLISKLFRCLATSLRPASANNASQTSWRAAVLPQGAADEDGDHEFTDYSGPIKFLHTDCQVTNAHFTIHIDNRCYGVFNGAIPHYYLNFHSGQVVSGTMHCMDWDDGTFNGDHLEVMQNFNSGTFNGQTMKADYINGGHILTGDVSCEDWEQATFSGKTLDVSEAFQYGAFKAGTFTGIWKNGIFNGGTFKGDWHGGTWKDGDWEGNCCIGDGTFDYLLDQSQN